MSRTYCIVCFFRERNTPPQREGLPKGLTLEEAQKHCQREDTHGWHIEQWDTGPQKVVDWFHGYEEE